MLKKLCIILLTLCWTLPLLAETIVVGDVVDALIGQPIANVNVYFKGTKLGCVTNEEGLFMIRTNDLKKDAQMIVSAVGYKQQKYDIEKDNYVGVHVELEEKNNLLADVLAIPGMNMALPIVERTRLNRPLNDLALHPELTYYLTSQQQLYISDLGSRHLQHKLWQQMQRGLIQTADSSWLLPLYSANNHYQLQGAEQLNMHTTERAVLEDNADIKAFMQAMPNIINIYNNTILIQGKSFISPLASNRNAFYKYYLADSTYLSLPDSSVAKQYIVHFRTKNAFNPTFNGSFIVDSATYAIREVQLGLPVQNGLNYLKTIDISQRYGLDHRLEYENVDMIFDVAVRTDSTHIFPTLLMHRETMAQADEALPTASAETDTAQLQLLAHDAEMAMSALDSVPIIKIAKWIAYIINTGYIPTGTAIEVGNVGDIVDLTRYEGLHLGIPLRTNQRLWKSVSLEGYIAYGTKDNALKGMGQVQWQLPTKRRHIVGARYEDKYVRTEVSDMLLAVHENSIINGNAELLTNLIRGINAFPDNFIISAARRREFKVFSHNDWNDYLETNLQLRVGRMGYGDPFVGYHQMPSYKYKSLSSMFRLSFKEKKYDMYFRRFYAYNNLPVLHLLTEVGSYQTDDMQGERMYGRLALQVRQNLDLGIAGTLNYLVEGGLVLGAVPYPMLSYMPANQSFSFDMYRFSLMYEMQNAYDKYLFAHLHWDMEGLLFNQIPLVRYLRLHELLELKVAYGGLSSKHGSILQLPDYIHSQQVPYVEAGVGIGNILRVAELYGVFRLTNLSDTSTPWWGVRVRLHLGL